jgi:hypothetical protein
MLSCLVSFCYRFCFAFFLTFLSSVSDILFCVDFVDDWLASCFCVSLQGIDSWAKGVVPHFITSNAFIARAYAKLIKAFLDDCLCRSPSSGTMVVDPDEKIYIFELGTGSGKLSFFILKALQELRDTLPVSLDKIVYVMTDFAEDNIKFWEQHPALQTFIDQGREEFRLCLLSFVFVFCLLPFVFVFVVVFVSLSSSLMSFVVAI